ncbi:MAG: UPF0058 family protein [Halobacteriaceae archaeon]
MKKQELIHLHGLLAEVGNHVEQYENTSLSLAEYESQAVRPTSIHKSKTDHKAAVFALAKGITRTMDECTGESEAVPARAD